MKTTLLTFLFSIIIFSTNAISIVNNTSKDSSKNNTENKILKPDFPKTGTIKGWDNFAIGSSILFCIFLILSIIGASVLNNNNTPSFIGILVLIGGFLSFIFSFCTGIVSLIRYITFKKLKGKIFLFSNIFLWILFLILTVIKF